MREARKYPDYNVGEYVKRRALSGFKDNRKLQGEAAKAAINEGKAQLEMVRRQSALRGLYKDKLPSVMQVARESTGKAGNGEKR